MIEVRDEGRARIVMLDRSEKANALTAAMLSALVETVESAVLDQNIHALILTGAGEVFSAGADLDEVKAGRLARHPCWESLSEAIAEAPILTIAALNGTAAGGALGMVFACDLRVAVPRAKIFYPVMRLGVLPQPSDPERLRALVGPARAKAIFLGGVRVATVEALGWGLIDRIADDVVAESLSLAEAACNADRDHLAAVKELISNSG